MRIHPHWQGLDPQARGASVAMGNFDGVHLGHRAVIDLARRPQVPLGVVTFEPHPREYFAPAAPPFRLMNAEARANRLTKLDVDHLFQLPFDAVMAAFSPQDFARQVLADGLGITHVVVGADFCFGKGRAGEELLFTAVSLTVASRTVPVPLARAGPERNSSLLPSLSQSLVVLYRYLWLELGQRGTPRCCHLSHSRCGGSPRPPPGSQALQHHSYNKF